MTEPRPDEPVRVILEPEVYLVGRQSVEAAELNRFMADHGAAWESDSEVAAEALAEAAGRTCYMSFSKPRPGGNAAYLEHIKESGHGSVLEHGVWSLVFTGVSRSLTHELVRHRAGWAYSQLSQRYVDESVAEYVCPRPIRDDPALFEVWLNAVRQAHAAYVALAEGLAAKLGEEAGGKTERRKQARQAARSVLPNATETKIFVTANARALRHFLEQRGGRHAEREIRLLAGKLLAILSAEAPNLFGDYVREPLPDGTFEITTPYKKV